MSHKTTEVMRKVHGTDENGILRILLDTGASATIVLMDAIRDLTGPVLKEQTTMWNTVGGHFVTTLKREIQFTLSEFSTSCTTLYRASTISNSIQYTPSVP